MARNCVLYVFSLDVVLHEVMSFSLVILLLVILVVFLFGVDFVRMAFGECGALPLNACLSAICCVWIW